MRRRAAVVVSIAAAGALALVALEVMRRPAGTPYLRGRAVALRLGCFGCHGAEGAGGIATRDGPLGEVPPLRAAGALAAFVQKDDELREWVLDGRPKREVPGPASGTALARIAMPAYSGRISRAELDDLLFFLRAIGGRGEAWARDDPGHAVAEHAGCFACHGPDGRGGVPNPQSFTGEVPGWEGADFLDLCRSKAELREWIERGTIARFERNPLARAFMRRMAIRMPAYAGVLSSSEVEAIEGYVARLRGEAPSGLPPGTGKVAGERAMPEREPPPARPIAGRIARGRWLYRARGCAACHGAEGRGGVGNPNSFTDEVPALAGLAEELEVRDPGVLAGLLEALDRGEPVEALASRPPLALNGKFLRRYDAFRDLIITGERTESRDDAAPRPPIDMPPWSARLHADPGPISIAEVDAILAYLLGQSR